MFLNNTFEAIAGTEVSQDEKNQSISLSQQLFDSWINLSVFTDHTTVILFITK